MLNILSRAAHAHHTEMRTLKNGSFSYDPYAQYTYTSRHSLYYKYVAKIYNILNVIGTAEQNDIRVSVGQHIQNNRTAYFL